jgi:hypothetical protein
VACKDLRHIAAPFVFYLILYAFRTGIHPRYQLAAVVSSLSHSLEGRLLYHCVLFLAVFGQLIRSAGTDIKALNESTSIEDDFPETDGSAQTTSALLCAPDIQTRDSLSKQFVNHVLFFHHANHEKQDCATEYFGKP